MKQTITRILLRSLTAVPAAVLPAIGVFHLLNASGPIAAVCLWAAAASVLLLLSQELSGIHARIPNKTAGALILLGGLIIIADIVIIPFSAYQVWFSLVLEGSARGAVSFVFVMLTAMGSLFFGVFITKRPAAASAGYISWVGFLAAVVLNRTEPAAAAAAALLVLLLITAVKGYPLQKKLHASAHTAVIIIVSAFLALVFGLSASPRGSRLVDDIVHPVVRNVIVTAFPSFPIVYDIPGYGFRFSRENLGRPPALSNRPVFEVESIGRSMYLKTEMFYQFTGSAWREIPDISQDSIKQKGTQIEDRYLLAHAKEQMLEEDYLHRVRITILDDYYSMVPHTLQTIAFSVLSRDDLSTASPSGLHGYQLKSPLFYGDVITLYDLLPRKPLEADAVLLEHALRVPDHIPSSVRDLAMSLKGETERESILNILRFFREHFQYTLTPPQPRDGDQFLYTFLEDHRSGFCVHFASAFTLLSRLQGVPARYVGGFLVSGGEYGPGPVTVTGYSAHAWSEIWLPEIGWYTVEATPPMQPYGYEDTFFDRFFAVRDEGRTYFQLREMLGEDFAVPQEDRETPSFPVLPIWLIIILPAGVILILSVYGIRSRDADHRFQTQVKKIHAVTIQAGFPAPETYGWTRWAAVSRKHSPRAASIILAVCFGGKAPTNRDIRFLKLYRRWFLSSKRKNTS